MAADYDPQYFQDKMLQKLLQANRAASFSIPAFDYQEFTYFGATNNIQTQVFKSGGSGGTTVATLTYAYAGGGAANDDLITSITQS